MDAGRHVMLPEKENVYDTIQRQWAATTTSIKGKSEKIGACRYIDHDTTVQEKAGQGWALKKQKATVRISPAVKQYLTLVFNEGAKEGQSKANPADVAEDVKMKFARTEWLEAKTIKGYFSRLAALQKGQEMNEEETGCQDVVVEKEEFLKNLIHEAHDQIGLQHPLIYEGINLCELFVDNKLDRAKVKFIYFEMHV